MVNPGVNEFIARKGTMSTAAVLSRAVSGVIEQNFFVITVAGTIVHNIIWF